MELKIIGFPLAVQSTFVKEILAKRHGAPKAETKNFVLHSLYLVPDKVDFLQHVLPRAQSFNRELFFKRQKVPRVNV